MGFAQDAFPARVPQWTLGLGLKAPRIGGVCLGGGPGGYQYRGALFWPLQFMLGQTLCEWHCCGILRRFYK